jgi:hypothetical protein
MDELDELRLQVAEAKGWKWEKAFIPGEKWMLHPRETREGAYLTRNKTLIITNLPQWTRDIAAAWELVDEMEKSGDGLPGLIFKSGAILDDLGKTAWVFELRLFVQGVYKFNRHEILGVGETPAEAICRAYLQWKDNAARQAGGGE